MSFVTRFAPSPSGPLHLGHAYSAIVAHDRARERNGAFLLRMDDIDADRCRPEWERQAMEDLAWLGLSWPEPVWRQSRSAGRVEAAIGRLADLGLLYPCRCTRRDVERAAGAPQEGAPTHGPDGRIYPGTCRGRPMAEAGAEDALRLDMAKALEVAGAPRSFVESGPLHAGEHRPSPDAMVAEIGDVVVGRRLGGLAYHLCVVVDDHAQGITEVTRGADLFEATRIHVLLQQLLGLETPGYFHHGLVRDERGKRLAKRDDARAIARYRADGASPSEVRALAGLAGA